MTIDLVYRATKGSKLTSEEGDANFLALAQAIELGLPRLIAQRFTAITRTSTNGVVTNDTDYQVLTSVTLPGYTMGLNSKLVIVSDWDVLTTGNTKSVGVDFGGSTAGGVALSSTMVGLKMLTEVQNINSLVTQKMFNSASYGTQTVPRLSSSIDTTADVVIDFKAKWSANIASQTITLIGYSIWHYPGS